MKNNMEPYISRKFWEFMMDMDVDIMVALGGINLHYDV
jgi:hypothetical protein